MNIKDGNCKFFSGNECLDSYLKDVRKHKVMSAEEEKKVFEAFSNGSKEARERIINSNQRFIYSMAKRYAKDENEVLDYVQEGNIGLMTALNEFDISKGNKFITFAVFYIRRSMNYHMCVTNNLVKRSNAMKIGKKADKIREKYFNEHGESPTNETVMELIKEIYGIEIKDECDIRELNVDSISEEIGDEYVLENDKEFTEKTASYNEYEDTEEHEYISNLVEGILNEIPDKLRKITEMYFGIGYKIQPTINDICKEMNMYPEDVMERVNSVINYLKDKYKGKRVV